MAGAAPLWILVVTFAVMLGGVVLDRAGAAAPAPDSPPAPGRNGHAHGAAVAQAVAPAAEPALAGPQFAELSAHAEGWALVGPAGTVVATNLPERAALLAGACAVLRLASGEQIGEPFPWRTVMLEGPSGVLLGEASPRGAVLAVLARRGADVGRLRAEMGAALGEVERRWPLAAAAAARPRAVPPGDGRAAALADALPAGLAGAPAAVDPPADPGAGDSAQPVPAGTDGPGVPGPSRGAPSGAYLPLD